MTIIFERVGSDSPFIETLTQGYTLSRGETIRPAETNWHLVLVKECGQARAIVTGPQPESGLVRYGAGGEVIWIQFRLGVFMPHMAPRQVINTETILPDATRNSFYLHGSAWQFPEIEQVDAFVERLVRSETLVMDHNIGASLRNEWPGLPARTLRHRFLRATGLSEGHIRQVRRAKAAAALLEQGVSITDVIEAEGYFDQPHLTRSLKRFVGFTPAGIIRRSRATVCHSVQENPSAAEYHTDVLVNIR